MPSPENNLSIENVNRRRFLKFAIGLFNGLIALLLAVPGLGYLLTPVFRKGAETWVKIGSLSDFLSETPQKAIFKYISETDYTLAEKTGFVWVFRNPDESVEVVAFSATCTHMGCNVAWDSGEEKFVCPCHGGRYDLNGEVLSGPPPRPLHKLPVKIANDQITIQIPA